MMMLATCGPAHVQARNGFAPSQRPTTEAQWGRCSCTTSPGAVRMLALLLLLLHT